MLVCSGSAGSCEAVANVRACGVELAVVAGRGLDVFRLEYDVFPASVRRVDDLAIKIILDLDIGGNNTRLLIPCAISVLCVLLRYTLVGSEIDALRVAGRTPWP